jgi:hypothetical protein
MNNVDELEPLVRQAPLSLVYEPETNKFSITQNNKIVYIYNKLINPKLETLLQQEGNINIHFKNGECHFDFIGDFFDDYGDVSF